MAITEGCGLAPGRMKLNALLALINSAAQDAMREYEQVGDGVPSSDLPSSHALDAIPESLALKKAIRVLEGACEQLCTTLAPPSHTIINVRSQCLLGLVFCIDFSVSEQ